MEGCIHPQPVTLVVVVLFLSAGQYVRDLQSSYVRNQNQVDCVCVCVVTILGHLCVCVVTMLGHLSFVQLCFQHFTCLSFAIHI